MHPSEIIDALGGTFCVAKLCEVKPPSVSGWRKHGIPRARLMFLRIARPDAFKDIDSSADHAQMMPGDCQSEQPSNHAVQASSAEVAR